jgi:fumarylacetoacetase
VIDELDETHNPGALSWVSSAREHRDFPVQNLPLAIFSTGGEERRAGVAIGDRILDLKAACLLMPESWASLLTGDTLNALFAAPPGVRKELRRRLFALLTDEAHKAAIEPLLIDSAKCVLHLPANIGDYTDFYTGIHHAVNAGSLFRPDAPLQPNYKWVPIGYHGRASSVRPSGTDVVRPHGQQVVGGTPVFEPTRRLDYELEMGVWIGSGNALGQPVPIGRAAEHIVGLSLLNDWSARDVQMWEMQPLGPFLAKSFQTSVSPWVVTREALAPFRIPQPPRPAGDPQPLGYLADPVDQESGAFAIELEVHLTSEKLRQQGAEPIRLSHGRLSTMYWTVAQMITHHSSNGCDLRPGDLLGTGTISEPTDDGFGSLLEISRGGQRTIALPGGETRTMLDDGDEIIFTARANIEGRVSIGFGECRGRILPATSEAI